MKDIIKYQGFEIGLADHGSSVNLAHLIDLTEQEGEDSERLLEGRGFVLRTEIPPFGPVVLKQYHRGGLLGKINSSYYLRFSMNRPAHEYRLLEFVRSNQIEAPKPLAWLTKGKLFYQGWLLMEEIKYKYSLADCHTLSPEEVSSVLGSFSVLVEKLIRARIYHVDLHPGNVLVDANGKVSLIDFDKACIFSGPANILRDKYLCRWRRAVIKHGLPDFLSEHVCALLRKNFGAELTI